MYNLQILLLATQPPAQYSRICLLVNLYLIFLAVAADRPASRLSCGFSPPAGPPWCSSGFFVMIYVICVFHANVPQWVCPSGSHLLFVVAMAAAAVAESSYRMNSDRPLSNAHVVVWECMRALQNICIKKLNPFFSWTSCLGHAVSINVRIFSSPACLPSTWMHNVSCANNVHFF